jgi:hypothetical protein
MAQPLLKSPHEGTAGLDLGKGKGGSEMRKVFAICAGLLLLSMFAACSDDSTPTPPKPHTSYEITTSAVPVGYTCSPYNVVLGVHGGVAPYTWALADGSDPLPEGLALTTDGRITGVLTGTGDFSFTVRVTDSSPTPQSLDKAFDMSVDAPSNPSIAIFYDGEASVCSTGTAAWTPLQCYVFLMLDNSETTCSQACEFKLRLTDNDGVDLDAGSEYAVVNVSVPSYVAVSLGDLFNGFALGFSRPEYGPEPIMVASFNLLLLEDLSNLSFKFAPNPGGTLGIASCETGYPIVDVTGRETALNYGE